MRWHLLPEERQKVSGNLVAVAVAYDDLTAKMVQSYLIDHRIFAFVPDAPAKPLYPVIPHDFLIWVPQRQREEAIDLLKALAESDTTPVGGEHE